MVFTNSQLRRLVIKGLLPLQLWCQIRRMRGKQQVKTYKRKPFSLDNFTEEESVFFFRFTQDEIRLLVKAFRLPILCQTRNKLSFTGEEGLCILLRRLCYPNRLGDLVKTFSRDTTAMSRIFRWMLNYIFDNYGHLVTTLNHSWLSKENLKNFAEACYEAGSVLPNICGFIDGTARPICRPSRDQRQQYSGYKKEHCLKYQSVVFPNGLIGRLDGPFNGRRHDA
ncbi:unnamed protein product, partial [Allacma fusca]